MAVHQSDYAKGTVDLATPEVAGEVVAHFLKYTWPAAGHPLNDVIELGVIPAGFRVVDMAFHPDDLDTATALQFNIGVMTGTWQDPDSARTGGNEFFSADTTAQAGGIARMSAAGGFNVAASNLDRSIGLTVAAAAGGSQTGQIRLNVLLASE